MCVMQAGVAAVSLLQACFELRQLHTELIRAANQLLYAAGVTSRRRHDHGGACR